MNSLVTVQITGKNVKRFIQSLYKRGIRFYHISHSKDSSYITVSYQDYLILKDIPTIYEIRLIRYQGFIRYYKLFQTYRMFLFSIFLGILFACFLSHVIFSVEVVHSKKEIRDFVLEKFEEKGIHRFGFVRTFQQGERIVSDILNEYHAELEWLEMERIGTKYMIRVQERKTLDIEEDTTPRDLIAAKRGVLVSISASQGEVIKKVHDYVEAGDVIVTGVIKNKDTIKDYVHAEGEVFAETWYHTVVEVPFSYKETHLTGKKHNVLSFQFFNSSLRLFHPFHTKQDTSIFSLQHSLLPISISYLTEEETSIEDSLYTYDMALVKAGEIAKTKLKDQLSKDAEILYQKNLKIYEENSKIVIEMFFKVKENITSYLEIRTDLENLEDKEER